jgi:anti-sigma B factor antagonist
LPGVGRDLRLALIDAGSGQRGNGKEVHDDFSVDVRRDGARTVVAPHGEIDISTVDAVREAMRAVEDGDLVLDLRDVSFLDTSGLAAIVAQQRSATATGRGFALVQGPPNVERIFDIAGLSGWLTFLAGDGVDVPRP